MNNKDMPAFPLTLADGATFNGMLEHDGFSKREYMAALAMQGLLSNYQAQQKMCEDSRYNGTNFASVLAINSIEFADAILTELARAENDLP